ncbi:MAG: bifunctional DNA-formamidopyrimidine glycosylase/DNA-(apurinic or apyrimidinic site) lyase [Rickettsiaceae bacterium]|nr:MAG: bifunctional DNA-formamidopyrimidine glycosylase/DNA-(apurinic or apyrimidinic site) lyase [Rickettsiaceae bacterium]
MPELPEVETLKLSLKKNIIGQSIRDVDIRSPKLRYPIPAHLRSCIISTIVTNLTRRAKYLIFTLSNNNSLIIHLGMTGRLFYLKNADTYLPKKHDHVIFLVSNGYLIFNDTRRFGLIDIINTSDINDHKIFTSLGPEPLSEQFNEQYFYNRIKKRKTSIKTAIMDNTIIVGVGNIYASESLFLSHIHPEKSCCNLSKLEIKDLVNSIKQVLLKAITAGGTTFKDFLGIDNQPGNFKQQLTVYGRAGQECMGCNNTITKLKQSGRASFYCPNCQIL